MTDKPCPCGTNQTYSACCGRYISGVAQPSNAEQLMRSRYSAYTKGEYHYILQTYVESERRKLSVAQLAEHSAQQKWLKLTVEATALSTFPQQVEFRAYYSESGQFYCLHERSYFVFEADRVCYERGDILSDSGLVKLKRNDICLCGSHKKFKKCCGK